VYLFIKASASQASLDAYRMPPRLLRCADRAWRAAKREEATVEPSKFELDVRRVLGLININTVELKARPHLLSPSPLSLRPIPAG
jgi:hypothetical protein